MGWVLEAALGFFACAGAGAFSPICECRPLVPVPACTVIELNVSTRGGYELTLFGKLFHERQITIVLGVYCSSFTFGLADHGGELAHARTERFGKVDGLGAGAGEASELGDEIVEVCIWIGAVAFRGFLGALQF